MYTRGQLIEIRTMISKFEEGIKPIVKDRMNRIQSEVVARVDSSFKGLNEKLSNQIDDIRKSAEQAQQIAEKLLNRE